MRTCFVPLCDVKNKDQPNRTMFLVPREQTLFAQWAEALPKVRTLRYTDKVCYLHFDQNDIMYTFDHCINGQIYKIKRDRPRLRPDSIPCLKMTTTEELLSYRVKPRLGSACKTKVITICDDDTTLPDHIYDLIMEDCQKTNETENISNEFQVQEDHVENSANIIIKIEDEMEELDNHECEKYSESENQIGDLIVEECPETERPCTTNDDTKNEHLLMTKRINLFHLLYDKAYKVSVPNTLWAIHRCPNRTLLCFSYMDILKMQVTKMLCIKTDGSVQLIYDGNVIKSWQLLQDINDLASLSIILERVDMWRICFGKFSNSNCDIIVEENDDNRWITEDNEHVFLCKFCLQMK